MHPQALGAAVTTAQVATTRGSFPQWESFHGGQHCKPAQKWQYVKVVWTAIMQTLKKCMFYQCMSRARRLFSHSSALSGKFFCAHLKSNFKASRILRHRCYRFQNQLASNMQMLCPVEAPAHRRWRRTLQRSMRHLVPSSQTLKTKTYLHILALFSNCYTQVVKWFLITAMDIL